MKNAPAQLLFVISVVFALQMPVAPKVHEVPEQGENQTLFIQIKRSVNFHHFMCNSLVCAKKLP